jgi:hypothetical protein
MVRGVSVMIASLAVLGAAGVARADTPACPPAVVVGGDAGPAAEVERHLRDLDLGAPATGCPAVHVTVRHADAGLAIQLEAAGQRVHRELTGPRVAATWIEGWARKDLRAPLLAIRSLPAPLPDPRRAGEVASTAAVPARASRVTGIDSYPSGSERDAQWLPVSLAVRLGDLGAEDDSSWRSIDAQLSTRWGSAFVGATARLGRSRGFHPPELASPFDRDLADVVLAVGAPWQVGRVLVTWSVAAGAGLLRTRRQPMDGVAPQDPNLCPPDQPSDPNCCVDMICPPMADPAFTTLTISGRVSSTLTASVPLGGQVFLDLDAGLDLMPGAHTAPHSDPTFPDDPFLALPGEPSRFLRLGVGLRIGAP